MQSESMVRTRIAPSPTGYPHIGTIFQALFDYVYAKKHGGRFIIRIEDTDRKRAVPEAEAVIYEALEYYGLKPDEGPKYGGDFGPYRQSDRLDLYRDHAQKLIVSGHAYYCFCSPERLSQVRQARQQNGLPPMYDRHCRTLDPAQAAAQAQTQSHVIRLKVPDHETLTFSDGLRGPISFASDVVDDQVLLKSDGFPTYHLAVVVDDHLMQISHVIRGEEWISSTPKHLLLYRYFNWDLPQMIHTPLLRNPDRSKISKRHGHTSAFWYRDQGYLVEAVLNFMATRVWNHPDGQEVFTLDDMIKLFDFNQMHLQGPIMDLKKLDWLNGQWLRRLDDRILFDRLQAFLPAAVPADRFKALWPHYQDRLVKLADLPELTGYLAADPQVSPAALIKEAKMATQDLAVYLAQVSQTLTSLKTWQVTTIETALRQLQTKLKLNPRPAFMTIRLAVTGQSATPPLFDVLAALGLKTVIKRLNLAQKNLLK